MSEGTKMGGRQVDLYVGRLLAGALMFGTCFELRFASAQPAPECPAWCPPECTSNAAGVCNACQLRPSDYAVNCQPGDAVGSDRDCDGYPDLCDTEPDRVNRPGEGEEGPGSESDTDSDRVEDASDNCPRRSNADQADHDHDGKGDACDVCPEQHDVSQVDTDSDGVGDACDVCPNHQLIAELRRNETAPRCEARVTDWQDRDDRERRSHLSAFFRPTVFGHAPLSDDDRSNAELAAGFHLMLTGSIDRWQLLEDHVAVPPAWFFHVGGYADFTPFTANPPRFGPVLGVDLRPLGNASYASTFAKNLRVGLQLYYLTGRPVGDAKEWVKRLGIGPKVAFLDIVSLAPSLEFDAGDGGRVSLGALLLFDFKYLEDLGVADVLRLPTPK